MDKRPIKKVAIYVRKSRKEETDETLKRQEEVLISFCEKHHWSYEKFKEIGSSQNLDRPELQKMLKKIKLFLYDAIVVADLDRLSRNTGHFGIIKEIIIASGCFVITPLKIYDFTQQDDDLFSDIQSVMAKNEYQNIKRRLDRGVKQSARDGNWVKGKTPVGYIRDHKTKKLAKTSDAKVISKIFDLYLKGYSTKNIADKFIQDGVTTTKNTVWSPSGITQIMNNPAYRGLSILGQTKSINGKRGVKTNKEEQIIVENTHEPIVSPEKWIKIEEIKNKRNTRPPSIKIGKHVFSGLIKCALCGHTHSFQKGNRKNKVQRIASCQTRIYHDQGDLQNYTTCPNEGCTLEQFEELFYKDFIQYVNKIEKYYELIKNETVTNEINYNDEIKEKEKTIQKLENDIKRVQKGFVMEIFSDEEAQKQISVLKKRINSYKEEIETLNKMDKESEKDILKSKIKKIKAFFTSKNSMKENEANNILREIVDMIIYKKINGKISIKIIYK